MKLSASFSAFLLTGALAASPLFGQELLPDQELLLRYNFDEAESGTTPTIDHGTADPRVDGRFFIDATRTTDTPGSASIAALDVTGSGHVLANYGHEAVDSLDGKLDNLDKATVTLWVNLQGDPANLDRIFSTGSNGVGFRIENPMGDDAGELSASNFSLTLDTADGGVPSYTNFDAADKWVFLAATFDGTIMSEEMVHFYTGDAETESTNVRALGTMAQFATTTLTDHLFVGGHPSATGREINGYVDDVRIYRGVLTPEQVEEVRLANLEVVEPPAEDAMIIGYNFDEAESGDADTLDLGEIDPLIAGRFFGDATRTTDTPGGFSTAALDVTGPEASLLVNQDDLDGKLDNLTAFTTTMWVNLQADPRALDRIFRAGSSEGFGYRIVDPTSGAISASNFGLTLDIGPGGINSGADFDADNKWLFLAVTFDANEASDNVRFVAGDESTSVSVRTTQALSTSSTGVLDSTLRLGRHPEATARIINGYIDDFRVYRSALSTEEIEAIRLENLGDGSPATGFEGWVAEHFDTTEQADPSITGPSVDPEGDGVPNILEYALGGSPSSNSRDLLPSVEADGSGYLTLTFVRADDVTDIDYIVESSTDLGQWAADAVHVDSTSVDGGVQETYRAPDFMENNARTFLRLRVEDN